MSDYPMLISNKLHSFRNFRVAKIQKKHNYWLRISLIYTLPAEMQFIHLTILAKIQSHSIFSRKNQWCF